MTDLKPCPFCGGKAKYRYSCGISIVVCKKCGASSKTIADYYEVMDGKQEVIEFWNRRANDDD